MMAGVNDLDLMTEVTSAGGNRRPMRSSLLPAISTRVQGQGNHFDNMTHPCSLNQTEEALRKSKDRMYYHNRVCPNEAIKAAANTADMRPLPYEVDLTKCRPLVIKRKKPRPRYRQAMDTSSEGSIRPSKHR